MMQDVVPSPTVREAVPSDREAVEACVKVAYAKYIARIGKPPAPILADYAALIATGEVYVIEAAGQILGAIVIELRPDHLFIENVAVHPDAQGTGLGYRLMRFAEETARANHLTEIRLYTHELMTENLAYYPRLGFQEVE